MVTVEHRQSAAEVSERVEWIMGSHGVVLAECCLSLKDPGPTFKCQTETAQMNSNSVLSETVGRSDSEVSERTTPDLSSSPTKKDQEERRKQMELRTQSLMWGEPVDWNRRVALLSSWALHVLTKQSQRCRRWELFS
jgi:hypothetical protein